MANCNSYKLTDTDWANHARISQLNHQQHLKLTAVAISKNKYRQLSTQPVKLVETRQPLPNSVHLPQISSKNPLWHGHNYNFSRFTVSRFYSDNSMQKAYRSEFSKKSMLTQESFMREELDTLHAINTQRQTFYKEDSIYRNRLRRVLESQQLIDIKYNSAAIIIQKYTRGFISRLKHNYEHTCIKKLKLQFRLNQLGNSVAHVETMFEPEMIIAAIKIQTFFRKSLAKAKLYRLREEKKQKRTQELKLRSTIRIQTHFRMRLAMKMITLLVLQRENAKREERLKQIKIKLKWLKFKNWWERNKMNIPGIARKYNIDIESIVEQDYTKQVSIQEPEVLIKAGSKYTSSITSFNQIDSSNLPKNDKLAAVESTVKFTEENEGLEIDNQEIPQQADQDLYEEEPKAAAGYTKKTHSYQQKIIPKESETLKLDDISSHKKKPALISSRNPILAPTVSRLEYMRQSKKPKQNTILEPWKPPLISEPPKAKPLPEVKKATSLIRIPSFIHDTDDESDPREKNIKSKATSIIDESDQDITEKDNLFVNE